MANPALHRSFIALHLTLALVIIFESARSLVHAFGALAKHHHMALLGGTEIVAALLFLWPGTVRIGGSVLVAIFVLAVPMHALRGEFPVALLVYAPAVLFVSVHGSAWGVTRSEATA